VDDSSADSRVLGDELECEGETAAIVAAAVESEEEVESILLLLLLNDRLAIEEDTNVLVGEKEESTNKGGLIRTVLAPAAVAEERFERVVDCQRVSTDSTVDEEAVDSLPILSGALVIESRRVKGKRSRSLSC